MQGTPQIVDATVGDGHVVMFAIRPFWRWQTQGTFFLGFNAILNWNDLGVGQTEEAVTQEAERYDIEGIVTPAFTDPHSHIGMFREGEPSSEAEGNDRSKRRVYGRACAMH